MTDIVLNDLINVTDSVVKASQTWQTLYSMTVTDATDIVLNDLIYVPDSIVNHHRRDRYCTQWLHLRAGQCSKSIIDMTDIVVKGRQAQLFRVSHFNPAVIALTSFSFSYREGFSKGKLSGYLYIRCTLIHATTTQERKRIIFSELLPKVIEREEFESDISFVI